jgi:hypothetical protein
MFSIFVFLYVCVSIFFLVVVTQTPKKMWKKNMKFIDELGVPVWWTTEARRRCQWEAQETTREERDSTF